MSVDRRPRPAADGGRVVPNYAFTAGRTRPAAGPEMPVEALVTVTERGAARASALPPEHRAILEASVVPQSLAEIGVLLSVPVGVARVLVGDLVAAEHLAAHLPLVGADGRPRRELLERLLDGLRSR